MLYPQSNPLRQALDISGIWDFCIDPRSAGASGGWAHGLPTSRPIAVPASWNDQYLDLHDYLGLAWYQTTFDLPWGWDDRKISLRFGSVNYLASVWVNGVLAGRHEGGHLPFEFDISALVQPQQNRLVVCVDGALAPDRVPPGNVPPDPNDVFANQNFPAASFDFFPYCGIHRPVWITARHPDGIDDLKITTGIDGVNGEVAVELWAGAPGVARFLVSGHGAQVSAEAPISGGRAAATLAVPSALLWEPGAPHLYTLAVEVHQDGAPIDRYTLPIGIRTIAVAGDRLLLNGKPIVLKGFGRHEDFAVAGRGLLPPVIVKDYALLEWIGANSFRTSHYPYSEEMLMLADRLGYLVIAETPAVGLFFAEEGLARRLELCRQFTQELIERDRNHPSVIIWSLANEPHSRPTVSKGFFAELYDQARSLDTSRPITIVSYKGLPEESFDFLDVVCLNRYFGWYSEMGQLELGLARLSEELDALHTRYPKPLIVTEFGADALPGLHTMPPEMFSEEYQADFIIRYVELFNSKPYIAGQHVWNLCDFKTAQAVHRVGGMNYKGIFTRDRQPKLAAHKLRALWTQT